MKTPATVNSPCIRHCGLNEHDICMGCYRSIDEITIWASIDNQARLKILLNAKQRRSLAN